MSLDHAEILEAVKGYDFHELDIEACLEENQMARIDSYDDYMFLALHFPKYNTRTKTYELNEFDVFIGEDFIITFRDFEGIHIDKIFERYQTEKFQSDDDIRVTPGFILYQIIESMFEKMFKICQNIRKDMRIIEREVFQASQSILVRDIMIKKRNIIVLKHMFKPQISVMKTLEFHMNKFFDSEIEAYFEDLEDKLDKIVTDILILEEYVESIEDAFKSMIDIQTNTIIKFLTIFSAFHLPLTLLTGFYGMNVDNLPFQHNFFIVAFII